MVSGGKVDKTRSWAIHHLGKHGVKWRVEGKDNIVCLPYATFAHNTSLGGLPPRET